ncbi:MAG: hypothetical protein HQK55_02130 [Deltaproteobacteria bacterium]|nr:hypothetical protein [Deltaproteobacteria bacterium]
MPLMLDCLTRRQLLNSTQQAPDKYRQIAHQMVQEGFISDAVDFLSKSGDAEGIDSLVEQVINEGDYFLLLKTTKNLGRMPNRNELERLVQKAAELGKTSFAIQAAKQLESLPLDLS